MYCAFPQSSFLSRDFRAPSHGLAPDPHQTSSHHLLHHLLVPITSLRVKRNVPGPHPGKVTLWYELKTLLVKPRAHFRAQTTSWLPVGHVQPESSSCLACVALLKVLN